MPRSIVSWLALVCMVLMVSAVTAVPYEASESTKDLFDADAFAKSLAVGVTPSQGEGGKVSYTVNLGSTDTRYQALSGKSFAVDPETTTGGIAVGVSSTNADVRGLLSGKRVDIPSSALLAIDSSDMDSVIGNQIQSEVTGLVSDSPLSPALLDSMQVGVLGITPSYVSCRQIATHAFSSSTYTAAWTATKEKCKAGWKATKETVKSAWNDPKQFFKDHWMAILIAVIVIIIVAIIILVVVLLLTGVIGPAAPAAGPPAAAVAEPPVQVAVETALNGAEAAAEAAGSNTVVVAGGEAAEAAGSNTVVVAGGEAAEAAGSNTVVVAGGEAAEAAGSNTVVVAPRGGLQPVPEWYAEWEAWTTWMQHKEGW
jgi:hypothetical protein